MFTWLFSFVVAVSWVFNHQNINLYASVYILFLGLECFCVNFEFIAGKGYVKSVTDVFSDVSGVGNILTVSVEIHQNGITISSWFEENAWDMVGCLDFGRCS